VAGEHTITTYGSVGAGFNRRGTEGAAFGLNKM